jgi:hypothetical protein
MTRTQTISRGTRLDDLPAGTQVIMVNATRYLRFPAALLAVAVLVTMPACAAGVYPQALHGRRSRRPEFLQPGGQRRTHVGIEDARRGRAFDVRGHSEWRDIDRQRIERDDAQARRRGFEAGYEQGYQAIARPEIPRDRFPSPAAQSGYRDGLEDGRRDARENERFDPVRSRRYRSADHDYDRRDGPLEADQREYRDAFQRGHEDGYRGLRR